MSSYNKIKFGYLNFIIINFIIRSIQVIIEPYVIISSCTQYISRYKLVNFI